MFLMHDYVSRITVFLISGGDSIFCATGITSGDLVSGINLKNDVFTSETLITHKSTKFKKIVKQEQNI